MKRIIFLCIAGALFFGYNSFSQTYMIQVQTPTDKKWTYANLNGVIIVKQSWERLGYFSDGLAWAKTKDDKFGFINKEGEWIIPARYDLATDFDPGTDLAEVRLGSEYCFITKTGELIHVKDAIKMGDFNCGLAWARNKNDKIGFVNVKGEWAIQPQFDAVRDFKNGFAAVKIDKSWGVVDKQGNWIIKPTYSAIKDVEIVDK